MSLPLNFTDFNWKQPKFCLLPTAINSRPKKYFHFTERQLPPGRDGVEWNSDDGYAEVGENQVDQQQMVIRLQLKFPVDLSLLDQGQNIASILGGCMALLVVHSFQVRL